MIVYARGADVCVAEPFLHLGDIGLVIECIGRGRRPQGVRADLEPQRRRVGPHQLIYAIRGDCLFQLPGAVVPDRPEQRPIIVSVVTGSSEIIMDQRLGPWMQRQIARLAAFGPVSR